MTRSSAFRLMPLLLILSVLVYGVSAGNRNSGRTVLSMGIFTAVPENDEAVLHWSLQQDRHTSHFVVEHSIDGALFSALDTVVAEGSSHSVSDYTYTHEGAASNPVNYYRLKELDKDGKISYSYIRVVRFADRSLKAVELATDTPGKELKFTVAVDEASIVIRNLNGNTVYKRRLNAGDHHINTAHWPTGTYHMFVYANDKLVETKPVLKF